MLIQNLTFLHFLGCYLKKRKNNWFSIDSKDKEHCALVLACENGFEKCLDVYYLFISCGYSFYIMFVCLMQVLILSNFVVLVSIIFLCYQELINVGVILMQWMGKGIVFCISALRGRHAWCMLWPYSIMEGLWGEQSPAMWIVIAEPSYCEAQTLCDPQW